MMAVITCITRSAESTQALGQSIGQHLTTATVIGLTGDLGCGKTVLVQGLARGLGVPDTYYITSPSYTLINEYPGRFTLYHVDLYRLAGAADFEDIGLHDILDGDGIVAVEWAERLDERRFTEHLQIHMEITDDHSRKIRLTAYGHETGNLIKSLEYSNAEDGLKE